MKSEYDFSKAERVKFYYPDAVFSFPIYLDPDVNDFMSQVAAATHIELQELVFVGLRSRLGQFSARYTRQAWLYYCE